MAVVTGQKTAVVRAPAKITDQKRTVRKISLE